MKAQVRFLKREASMSERESAVLSALQALTIEHSSLEPEIWHSIAGEALAGTASAQYIVATAFEELGNLPPGTRMVRAIRGARAPSGTRQAGKL